MVIFP
jgi:hypothetical protein